ncbi:hypothetical protein [Modicisalibacter sp. MOD 31.J]|uniref:hypothetical protein n=1 Tax=Modicisalibacter sp. MOD 31.J TaxID=2831897 RepID=UPI001CCA92FB|nr:hypothetical protein [Modicisalibacter sp. MOD 31.J]MBZ9574425.1 hypothetical protein [Modicisalibacter sp. MOD 31.J]
MPAITQIFSQRGDSYTVPAGMRAIVKLQAFDLSTDNGRLEVLIQGKSIFKVSSESSLNAEISLVLAAGSNIRMQFLFNNSILEGVVVLSGFIEEDT